MYSNHFVAQSHTKKVTKMSTAGLCLKAQLKENQNSYNREGLLTTAHQDPVFYLSGE